MHPYPAYEWMALAAAGCFALTGMLAAVPARRLGAFAFTRWRMLLVSCVLAPVVLVTGGWRSLDSTQMAALAASGLVGIFIGDTALFGAMNRLGPRRAGVLFATNALLGTLLGFVWLGERIGMQAIVGGGLVVAGVMLAILAGQHKAESHHLEANHGSWVAGVALGLLAALCQALGALLAKPVMVGGVDPVAATLVRVGVSSLAHLLLLVSGFAAARAQQPMTLRMLLQVALVGCIGMGLGMSLVLMALRQGDVGMVTILSSVSPVFLLPLLWWRMGRAPAKGAWLGAGLTVLGTALVLLR